jgi:hypothetical protein
LKRKNSSSTEKSARYPIDAARATTRFKSERAHAGWPTPSLLTKSRRNAAVCGSHGKIRNVERSIRAWVSWYPVDHPVTFALS